MNHHGHESEHQAVASHDLAPAKGTGAKGSVQNVAASVKGSSHNVAAAGGVASGHEKSPLSHVEAAASTKASNANIKKSHDELSPTKSVKGSKAELSKPAAAPSTTNVKAGAASVKASKSNIAASKGNIAHEDHHHHHEHEANHHEELHSKDHEAHAGETQHTHEHAQTEEHSH
ncbi:hypothetical protein BDR26DRAFT_137352 [Obelidium mucronatum]|nr:hypothetical protein BDR26DRAFT_137352 [Obelidium mucronatum]